jgi:hypothetical protein
LATICTYPYTLLRTRQQMKAGKGEYTLLTVCK